MKKQKETPVQILDNIDYKKLINPGKNQSETIETINLVEDLLEKNHKAITYTQLRNIFALIKNAKNVSELHMKRPRIAYIQARQESEASKIFVKFIVDLIRITESEEQLHEFKSIMETIVAYHKLFGK